MNQVIVFFDIETSGLDPHRHEIIQIAAIAVDGKTYEEIDTFEAKLRFNSESASPEALEVNSFDKDVWEAESIKPQEALRKFAAFLRLYATIEMISKRTGSPYMVAQLAGHNAAVFDAKFVQEWFSKANAFLPASYLVLDTLQLAIWHARKTAFPPENLKLGTLCKWLGVKHDDAHDALGDVRATIQVAKSIENNGS